MGARRRDRVEWIPGSGICEVHTVAYILRAQERVDRTIAEHELIDRLFFFWDTSCRGALSFQVSALLLYVVLEELMGRCARW